jgi:hypothetical protein
MPDTRPDPFELINTPFSEVPLERWRAEAMAGGAMGALQNVYDIVRADAASQAARADEAEARAALIEHLCTQVEEFERRFEDHLARLAEAEDRRRSDEAAKVKFDEEPLELPPGDPPGADETHAPGGELHELPPKDQDPEPVSELPEPPLETEADAGGVPLSYGNVPTSYVHGEDQSEFEIPEPEQPKGQAFPQPVSVSLNEG